MKSDPGVYPWLSAGESRGLPTGLSTREYTEQEIK